MIHQCLTSAERDHARSALLFGLRALTRDEPTTGLHLLFITADEAERCAQHDLLIRHTLQFQWTNEGYETFDDFLARFRSKRRNQIRRERRVLRDLPTVKRRHRIAAAEHAFPVWSSRRNDEAIFLVRATRGSSGNPENNEKGTRLLTNIRRATR